MRKPEQAEEDSLLPEPRLDRAVPAGEALRELRRTCEKLALGRHVDQCELNRLADSAYKPDLVVRFTKSDALELRLQGWSRAVDRGQKERAYLRRLAMFRLNLDSEVLREFLARHLAKHWCRSTPKDPLHKHAEELAYSDSSFREMVAAASKSIARADEDARKEAEREQFLREQEAHERARLNRLREAEERRIQEEKAKRQLLSREGKEATEFLAGVSQLIGRLAACKNRLMRLRAIIDARVVRRNEAEDALRAKLSIPTVEHCVNSPVAAPEDFQLCAAWANVGSPSHVRSWSQLIEAVEEKALAIKLLTARLGERAALEWYRALGHSAIDVSITQLEGRSQGGWLTHDILLDGVKRVDVKTARQTYVRGDSTVAYYSRFLVRHLNEFEFRGDIRICAVLARYVTVAEFEPGEPQRMILLGEVTRERICRIADFAGERLSGFRFIPAEHARYLPGWYFASEDAQAKLKNHLHGAASVFREALDAEARISCPEPLAKIFQSGSEFDEPWVSELVEIAGRGPLAAVVAMMAALSQWAQSGSLGAWDDALRGMISARGHPADRYPLGVKWTPRARAAPNEAQPLDEKLLLLEDPGEYARSFHRAIGHLVGRNSRQKLYGLREFVLSGPAILTAFDTEIKRRVTLIAYCGGIGCGCAPLVYGREGSCPDCGKLICPRKECRFCSERCSAFEERRPPSWKRGHDIDFH